MYKCREAFSLRVLIGRGLVLMKNFTTGSSLQELFFLTSCKFYKLLFGFQGVVKHAPLAQLVEHLTLNQGVQGSSP